MTLKANFHGNPNVGLYGYAHGEQCIIGERLGKQLRDDVGTTLRCTLHESTIAGTPMPGVFLAGNTRAVLAPSILFPHELAALKKAGLPVVTIETTHTCLGNNIVANEHGALVNPEFSDTEVAAIGDALGVPAKRIEIAGTTTPGACIVLHGEKGVIHRDAAQHELEMARATLKLTSLERASINLGSAYLRAGILNSDGGLIVGDQSGGPEIVHLEETLGYIDG